MDDDIFTWASRNQLSEHVVLVLRHQGYCSVSELCQLDDADLDLFFQGPGLLTAGQCGALREALATLPASLLAPGPGCPDSFLEGQNPGEGAVRHNDDCSAQHQPSAFQDDYFEDTYDPEEFEHIHHSFAAAAMEDAPRDLCLPLGTCSGPTGGATAAVQSTAPDGASGLEESVRILLAGKTGSGKSTTGNSILGKELFNTAPDFGSVTCECERQVAHNRNKRMEIMDTPGLYDTSKSHEEICTLIVQAVAGLHPGPHAILYVIKVGRFTPEEYAAYRRLKALFDDTITRHMILLFTHGDQLERAGVSLQELIRSPKTPDSLREVLQECGHRCVVFNNMAEDPGPQVDALLRQVEEVVAGNGGQPYCCPRYSKIGEGLEEEVNKRVQVFEKEDLKRQKYVQDLERQTKDAEMAAELTRQEFEETENQRREEMEHEDRRRRRMEDELREKLSRHRDNSEKQRLETVQVKKKLKQMEAEHRRLQDRQEKKRRAELKELDRKYKAMEREQQRVREEERRRERARAEEMERMKARVVKKEEPGFLSKAVDFIANPIKKVFGFFGL